MKLNKNAVVSNCGQCEYQNTSMYYYCEKLKRDTVSHPIPSDCPLADVEVIKNLGNTTIIDTIDNVITLDYPIEKIIIVKTREGV
jgi:hypothetical protein